jgi:hypothetical protein
MINLIVSVGGTFVANDYSFSSSGKLFVGFFLPQISLNQGIFIIENFIYRFPDTRMDYQYQEIEKPCLHDVHVVQIFSTLFYLLIAWAYPFDWFFSFWSSKISSSEQQTLESLFPSDIEDEPDNRKVFLDVRAVSHTYPDGTAAVVYKLLFF